MQYETYEERVDRKQSSRHACLLFGVVYTCLFGFLTQLFARQVDLNDGGNDMVVLVGAFALVTLVGVVMVFWSLHLYVKSCLSAYRDEQSVQLLTYSSDETEEEA